MHNTAHLARVVVDHGAGAVFLLDLQNGFLYRLLPAG